VQRAGAVCRYGASERMKYGNEEREVKEYRKDGRKEREKRGR
jgi:hypothetical protein